MNAVETLAFIGKYGPLYGNHSIEQKEFPLHSFYIVDCFSFKLLEMTIKNLIIHF